MLRGTGNILKGEGNEVIGNNNFHMMFNSKVHGSGNRVVGANHNMRVNGMIMFGPEAHPRFYNLG